MIWVACNGFGEISHANPKCLLAVEEGSRKLLWRCKLSRYEQLTRIVTLNPGAMRSSFLKLAKNLPRSRR